MRWKQITVRTRGEVVILDLAGVMCLCDDDGALERLIAQLLDQGVRCFVLNLRRVPYIDAPDLGAIVRSYTTVARRGGHLKLLHVHERLQRLFETTRLDSVLEVFASEDEAVSSFAA
jgi:anti-sigma B factor antagonist